MLEVEIFHIQVVLKDTEERIDDPEDVFNLVIKLAGEPLVLSQG